jgi:hypothetical protein
MAGALQPVHFPEPWARMPTMSFLQPPAEMRALIADSGFAEVTWLEVSRLSLAWICCARRCPDHTATAGAASAVARHRSNV